MGFLYSFSSNAVLVQIVSSDLCLKKQNAPYLHNFIRTVFFRKRRFFSVWAHNLETVRNIATKFGENVLLSMAKVVIEAPFKNGSSFKK